MKSHDDSFCMQSMLESRIIVPNIDMNNSTLTVL